MSDQPDDKLKKHLEKKRSREAEAAKKKLFKQVDKQEKKTSREDAKTASTLQKPKSKQQKEPARTKAKKLVAKRSLAAKPAKKVLKNRPEAKSRNIKTAEQKESKPKTPPAEKEQKAQAVRKPVNKKLKEASSQRKKASSPKSKPGLSEKHKAIAKEARDDKKSQLSAHLQQKAKSRETLEKQRLGLEAEVKALSNLANVKDTVDGQYTAKFSGFQSAVAAGPMGATSTGLRKLDPAVWINMQRAELGAKVQNKIEPRVLQQMAKIGKIVRDLKMSNLKEVKGVKMESSVNVAKEANAAMKKIVNSKLRSKIREIKDKERMRDPNRDPYKFDELNMPFRGFGGPGGDSGK